MNLPDTMTYRIGIDIGGTFTDLVAVDETGAVTFAKTPSTPEDQSVGLLNGLERLAAMLGLSREALLERTERIVHGMTVATNALLERKGAKLALLTTEGHRDVLEMREGLKPDRYNLRLPRQEALVPRHLRLGVRERMRHNGSVEVPLDANSLAAAIETLKTEQVESVAVCYLHSYANDAHERATAEAIRAALPGVYVCVSADVLPQIKEYERVSTTVVNGYVGPALQRYLRRLESRLDEAGYRNATLIVLSHGGVAPISEAIRSAVATVLSGPAGGLAGARHAAELTGVENLIPFDMGGTSSDISLVDGGEIALASDRSIAGERIALPSLDIVTLGAGGGSIARVDGAGLLQVGPHSAGAVPGPVCYGRGGTEPTVTDSNVVLGYLDPSGFLGGADMLDRKGAEAALTDLGERLGVSMVDAAAGVHRVVNTQMAEGIRLATVRRGVDPRRFALFGFGGAAGLHVTGLARMLDLRRVIVPRVASVLSAWGMLTTDLRYETIRTHIGDTEALEPDTVRALFGEMETDSRAHLASWFDGDVTTSRSADMRYGEQVYEIDVPLDALDLDAPDLLDRLKAMFEARHEALYTYSLPDRAPVLVNAKIAAIGRLPAPPQEPEAESGPEATPKGMRPVFLDGWIDAPIYGFDDLAPGQNITGPAIVEASTTTVLLREGDAAVCTPRRWLDIKVGA
ncbi:MAG: hydantoinase/oxoprolinase family protein [Alphaproteobacteria bacterium]|nr:hydantoinase/oxoprolinase family protein [Alphaproteobacteria bacterium]